MKKKQRNDLFTVQFLEKNPMNNLKKDLFITSKKYEKYGNVFALHYSQIKSPMNNAIVQECRGLVVELTEEKKNGDTVRKCKVLAYPYKKFFNYGV